MTSLTKNKAVAYLVALFAAGVVVGSTLGFSLGKKQLFQPPRHAEMSARIQSRLSTDLNLSEEQKRQLAPLVEQMAAEMQSVHSNSIGRICDVREKWHQQMAVYLTPEQVQKLEEMQKKRNKSFRHERKGRPPKY